MNINEPIKNPKLKDLMDMLKTIDVEDINYIKCKQAIYDEIVHRSKFLAIFKSSNEITGNTIPQGSKISFSLLRIQNTNDYVLPVFTDWDELYKWKEQASVEDIKAAVLSFDECIGIVKDGKEIGISINPFSNNLFIDKKRLIELKSHKD